jgi:uncharacterized protein (DUF58 family)
MKTIARRPSRRLVWLLAGLFAAAISLESFTLWQGDAYAESVTSWLTSEVILRGWLAAMALLAGACVFDLFAIRKTPKPEVTRSLPRNLALRDSAEISVLFRGLSEMRSNVELYDHPPEQAECDGLPLRLQSSLLSSSDHARSAGDTVVVKYTLRPMRRGDARFGRFTLRAASPLGLLNYTAECGEPDSVRVFPNFAAVARFGELMLSQHTSEVGIKKLQRRGEGLEFHQLREYRQGDSIRQVDWKVTARRQSLVSREYQDERDQRVIFLLDSSRRMRAKDGPLSHFDHSLNAMILLSHVALRAGDSVGLLSFGAESRWLPATKGRGSVQRILNTVYDLEPSKLGSDFSAAAQTLGTRQPRRSLVILLTNIRIEDIDDLMPGLQLMRRRHLVLVVSLREAGLEEVAQGGVSDYRSALRALGTWQHLDERGKVHEILAKNGIFSLDVKPADLHTQLINRYHAIKRSGEL